MERDSLLLRLADMGTPDASMPALRLSDIMTPEAEARVRETIDDETPVDSGHEASAPSTAIADLVSPLPDSAPAEDSEKLRRLKQEVQELKQENRLLWQKLNLLQTNSNLKQIALIGTVISWFGDKGLLDDEMGAAYELTSMMISARATEDEQTISAFADQISAAADDILQSDGVECCVKDIDESPRSPNPDSEIGRRENDDTSEWPSLSVDGSFNPPFSSSKKVVRHRVTLNSADENSKFESPDSNARPRDHDETYEWPSVNLDNSFNPPSLSKDTKQLEVATQNETLQTEGYKQQREGATTTVSFKSKAEENTDSFDKSAERLGNRIERMEKSVKVLSSQYAEMRRSLTLTRQNADRRFRIWKALAETRRLAALNLLPDEWKIDGEGQVTMKEQSLTQYPTHLAEETGGARMIGGSQNKEILGEIAFQIERRILAFVFQQREILYGYTLGNVEIMIRTLPDQDSRCALLRRYELLIDMLRGYGWLRGRHSQFVADMIVRHGIFQNVESARAEAAKRGWSNPSELKRGVLCMCPVVEILDMLVILDCLLHMARNDRLPVFLF